MEFTSGNFLQFDMVLGRKPQGDQSSQVAAEQQTWCWLHRNILVVQGWWYTNWLIYC